MPPDLPGEEPGSGGAELGAKSGIDSDELAGFDQSAEERIEDLQVHRRSHAHPSHRSIAHPISVLGGSRGAGNQMALSIFDQIVEEELPGLLHDWIGPFGEEGAVSLKVVVVPEVEAQPGRAP